MTAQPIINSLDFARLQPLLTGGYVDAAVLRLRAFLDQARKVAPRRVPPDVVTMNSRIRLRDGRRTWIMSLVFPENADPEDDRISVLAPLGAAILGCRVGQSVRFRVPGGAERSCDILSVLYQPEAAGDLHL